MTDHIKHSGQIFTPDYLVADILDEAGYFGREILRKHCIENSCGDGAFLREIVKRYATAYEEVHGTLDGVETELATYIHGIEIDPAAYRCCLENLESIANDIGISGCIFDITNEDAMYVTRFNGRMDYVIGNPPYVRVHNLDDCFDKVKSFKFANSGMTDLYLVFFEIGFNMMRKGGILCYITPSSWINS
ncbi:MAG: Eco57I restriction-modification methylase domain-containing protein, partial [Alistipes sp.]|nr:Eco57I restriction-modification methylase domain-containing protein [Alistipes sp.]